MFGSVEGQTNNCCCSHLLSGFLGHCRTEWGTTTSLCPAGVQMPGHVPSIQPDFRACTSTVSSNQFQFSFSFISRRNLRAEKCLHVRRPVSRVSLQTVPVWVWLDAERPQPLQGGMSFTGWDVLYRVGCPLQGGMSASSSLDSCLAEMINALKFCFVCAQKISVFTVPFTLSSKCKQTTDITNSADSIFHVYNKLQIYLKYSVFLLPISLPLSS